MWSFTGSLTTAHAEHTATLLPNGKVLVAGGFFQSSAEVYDPASGTWSATGSLNAHARRGTLLPSSRCWWQGNMAPPILPARRNCTTLQRTGARAASTPHAEHGVFAYQRTGSGGRVKWFQRPCHQSGTVRPCQRDMECRGQP
jgi:hypothetical protein